MPYEEIQALGFANSPRKLGLYEKPWVCISSYGPCTQLVNSNYKPCFSYSVQEVVKELMDCQMNKKYMSAIVDFFVNGLANVTWTCIIVYHIKDEKVDFHRIEPTFPGTAPNKSVELAFIEGHHDLVLDKYIAEKMCSDPNNESDPSSEYSPLGLTHVMNQYLGQKFTTWVNINLSRYDP